MNHIPSKEKILEEQQNFWRLLKSHNIEVLEADQVPDAKGQMFTRDLAFVIGDKFFISSMKKENRRLAIKGWQHIIDNINPKNIIKVPSNIYLEGGDVMINGKTIYVGISERTNMDGINFLKEQLDSSYEIIPLYLNPKFLHLDVVFTMINPNLALIYKGGFTDESYEKLKDITKIEVTEQEQFELGTNVFVIDPKTVIANKSHQRIINCLKEYGLNVIELDLTETAKDGGAFRCTTCPIRRTK